MKRSNNYGDADIKAAQRRADYKVFNWLLKLLKTSGIDVVDSHRHFSAGGPAVRGEGHLQVEAANGRMIHVFATSDACYYLGRWAIRSIRYFDDWSGGSNIWCAGKNQLLDAAVRLLKGAQA